MKISDSTTYIKTYFVVFKKRFDANELKEKIAKGGMEISKSFARAIFSKAQLEKYSRPVDNELVEAFLNGLELKDESLRAEFLRSIKDASNEEELNRCFLKYCRE